MSAKDAVKAREQSKRRPVRMPIEQSIHKRKPTKAAEPIKIVEPVETEIERVEWTLTSEEAEALLETEAEES